MSSRIEYGRIVWAVIPDSRDGNPKSRPAVVITPNEEIEFDGKVEVLAITTLLGEAPFSETVELPFDPVGHPHTRLKKRSEVVCSWSVMVACAEIRESGGFVPEDVMFEVLDKYRRA